MTGSERSLALFSAARALAEAERRAFLDVACQGNDRLRAEIDRLLSADAVDDEFLSTPPDMPRDSLWGSSGALQPGTVLKDRYEIEAPIASGGQAHVYRATDRQISRAVVVKVTRCSTFPQQALTSWSQKEVTALSRIDHPGVVGILDVGELDDGSPFLVIQYVNGVSLRALLQRGPIDPRRALRLLHGIASALTAAHAAGVGHHDLKPENVMVQELPDGTDAVKLIDFGIAKVRESDLQAGVTTVVIAGSVRYMAPEQFEGKNVVRSDVYALGLLACELLCGEPDARALPPTLARRVRPIIERALAFRPEQRPALVGAWVAELEHALQPAPSRERWVAAVVAAIATVTIAAAVIWPRAAGSDDRIIEKVGAFNPRDEGFEAHNGPLGAVVNNHDHTGFMGFSVTSDRPGGADYFRRLSRQQMQRALRQGWSLSATMHANQGAAYAYVDLSPIGKRFDINVLAEPLSNVVRLNTQLVPTIEGLTFALSRAEPVYHKYELRFDPSLEAAQLWVDGIKRLTGYRGHQQFQEGRGLSFGAAVHKSPRAMASFLSVRFEINP